MALLGSLNNLGRFVDFGSLLNTLIFIFVFLGIYGAYKRFKKVQLINKIPGPKTRLLFGNAFDVQGTLHERFKAVTEKFCDFSGSISRVWIGRQARCYIYKADTVEEFLKSKVKFDKGQVYKFAYPWLGNGILTTSGTKWHKTRKLLTTAFHFQVLESFQGYFNEQSAKLVQKLAPKANGEPFDLFPSLALCTLDNLLETVFGRSINVQDREDFAYVKAIARIQEILSNRAVSPWLFTDFMFKLLGHKKEQDETLKIIDDFTDEMIRLKRQERESLEKNSKDKKENEVTKDRFSFLDLLLDNEETKKIPELKIHEEANTLIFGGHDTTSTGTFWFLYLLGHHQEIQEKLFDEIISVVGDKERYITTDDLREMKYLDCCLKESFRVFPPLPSVSRLTLEDMTLGGYKIPAHTNVCIMFHRLHRDPEQFPDPEVFNPERFLPENCVNRHPYAYIPFSAGPRNCIGQKFAIIELKIMMCWILRNYRVESTVKYEDLELHRGIVLTIKDKKIMKLFKRK